MTKNIQKILLYLVGFLSPALIHATETQIIVRAKAKDAKFIGSSLGGAYIVIRNTVNNGILAEGKTAGTTGNTQKIMKSPRERDLPFSDDKSAKFHATIDIDEPVFIRIEVVSPYNHRQSQVRASVEMWLIPGKHILGDGVIIDIPGFIIDVIAPRTHQYIPLSSIRDQLFEIRANVVMMCGCVIDKGGTWNSDEMEVKAIIKKNGTVIQEVNMSLIEANLFKGNLFINDKGEYEFIVYAYNQKTGNTGVNKINFIIT
jgi:hypothetical protein